MKKKKEKETEALIRELGEFARMYKKIVMAAFLRLRKKCPNIKRTKWTFQKRSCKLSKDMLFGSIGPCIFDRCPLMREKDRR